MPRSHPADQWLLPLLEQLLPPEKLKLLTVEAGGSYWAAAVRLGIVGDAELLAAVSARYRMKVADPRATQRAARELVPEAIARRYRVLPLTVSDSVLEVATADPTDMECERSIAFATGRKVRLLLVSPIVVDAALDRIYSQEDGQASGVAASVINRILENVADRYEVQSVTEQDPQDLATGLEEGEGGDRPVIRLVDYVLAEGIASRASDIHLEPGEDGLVVRYRIDGVLRQVLALPRVAGVPLVSRVKIISRMDIADRMRPQDGRARVIVNGRQVDLRVSTLPASHGEKVVIRILDGTSASMSFDQLGMNDSDLDRLRRLLGTREGVVLVTGPTGSGKTTTLYTALRQIQERGGVNVVTVEDPVEYRLPGVVQVQVNEKSGLTFASALKSILRQDPDVVLVGEIRDRETAATAVQASLTGHLVFSTLHTLDAASSVARLVDIGVESYKIAAALKGVVAQRLLRRLCTHCRQVAHHAPPRRVRAWLPPDTVHHEAVGCEECGGTGYRGRLAALEVLIVDREVEHRIAQGQPVDRIVDAARVAGMTSLWESGVRHVRRGDTSVEELMRVLDVPVGQPVPRRRAERATAGYVVGAAAAPMRELVAEPSPPVLSQDIFRLVDEPEPAATPTMERSTALVAMASETIRLELHDLLERAGFTVLDARDGVVAIERVDRDAPDLVLLGVELAGLDGYEVLAKLRGRPDGRRPRVVLLSPTEDEEGEARAFDLDADDFLTGPFRERALLARLRALLRTGSRWKEHLSAPVEDSLEAREVVL